MNDEFILTAWRKPSQDFARQLRERLRRLDAQGGRATRAAIPLRPVAYAASLLLAVGLFALPSVRAGAEAFLDLFRIVNFAAVPVQQQRVNALLAHPGLDLPRMLGEQVHVLKAPGARQIVATAAEAGALAGIQVRLPAWRPVGLEPQQTDVLADQRWSVTASAAKLQQVLAAAGIEDLSVPEGIDGQTSTVYIPPVVRITYAATAGHATLVQARRPEASLPPGVDLARIAEIGLRVLGIDRGEAYRFAQNIDWRTTLVVPVPTEVAAFRQVDIQGSAGLLIQTPRSSRGGPPMQSQLLWSSGDTVFALIGDLRPEDLFEMAQSVQ